MPYVDMRTSIKNRILSGVIATVTVAASPAVAYAASTITPIDPLPDSIESPDEKYLFVNVKTGGGSVILNENEDSEQTVRFSDSKIKVYDKDDMLISEEESDVYVYEAESNDVVNIKAESDVGYQISEFTVADSLVDGLPEETGFTYPSKEFSYTVFMEEDTAVIAGFEEEPEDLGDDSEDSVLDTKDDEDLTVNETPDGENEEPDEDLTVNETPVEDDLTADETPAEKNDDLTVNDSQEPDQEETDDTGADTDVDFDAKVDDTVSEETPEGDLTVNDGEEMENKEQSSEVAPKDLINVEIPIEEPNSEEEPIVDDGTADAKEEHFLEYTEGIEELDDKQFETARLVVLTNNPDDIIDKEHLIASYGNIYLLQYGSIEQSKNAYLYYSETVTAVEADTVLEAASEAIEVEVNTEMNMTDEQNPVMALNTEADSMITQTENNVIALIDTGVSAHPNVIDRISLIDDTPDSTNKHGDNMVDAIVSQDENAKILSIKAMGSDGRGTVSSIVSAMEYAMKQGVSVINLSMSSKANLQNSVFESEIQKAVSMGIEVVGAAGNNGEDAADYMPGSVNVAWIIGAADETGVKLEGSNYGESVDYNVIASTTSEAAAKFSGYISANGLDNINLNQGLIYATDYVYEGEETEEPEGDSGEVEERPVLPPEYVEDSPAFDEEIWAIEGYPDYSSVNGVTEYVWIKDTGYDFKTYNPYGENVAGSCLTEIENVEFKTGNKLQVSYQFSLFEEPDYFWTDDVTFIFTDDRNMATVKTEDADKLLPEYVNQDRNEGYGGIVPEKVGDTVEGKEYNVVVNTEGFELEGLLMDYNPHTFKLNHIADDGGFDITKPGSYTVIQEISHFMYYDYSWFVKNTVNVVDPVTLEPGVYFTSTESTLMINRESDGLYGGYGDLFKVNGDENYIISCIDEDYEVGAVSSDPDVVPETICSFMDGENGTTICTVNAPAGLDKAVIISVNRPGYHAPKLHSGGGWQTTDLSEKELSMFSEEEFAEYEDELSGESDSDKYMNVAATWTTKKTKNFAGHLISGWTTGHNYSGGSPISACTNYGTVQAADYASSIAKWVTDSGYKIDKSKIKDFDVACISGHNYWGMYVNTRYSCTIKCDIQVSGSDSRLVMSVYFSPGGGYQIFSGSYVASVENNGKLKVKKMFRNSTIADKTGRVGTLKTVFGIYTDKACKKNVTNISLKNDEPGGYKTSGSAEVPAGTYYLKEIYQIDGCASNEYEVYGPIKVKAGQTVDISEYCKNNGLDEQWENMENGWVYNRPFYYRGHLLTKVDETTAAPLQGAVYKMEYSEYNSKSHPFKAKYTWYFETDEKGEFAYDDAHLAKGYKSSEMIRRRDDAPALPLGFLRIQEVKAPQGYLLDPQKFIVEIKNTTEDSYVAHPSKLILHKEKTDESQQDWKVAVNAKKVTKGMEPLAGAEFGVWTNPDCTGQYKGLITSGDDGMTNTLEVWLSKDEFPEEVTLYCKETTAPDGYQLIDEIFELTFYKKDFDALNPELEDNPDMEVKYETKTFGPTDGIVNEEGTTTPTPTPPPVTPQPPSGSGAYVKKTSTVDPEILELEGYSLAGAEFSITGGGFSDTMITDENGMSNVVALPKNHKQEWVPPVYDKDGNIIAEGHYKIIPVTTTYTVRETKPPKGHKLYTGSEPIVVTMPYDENKLFEVTFKNEPIFCKNKLDIEKLGVKGEPIEGVVFKVEFFDAQDAGDVSKLKKTWYLESDANGRIYMDEAHVSNRLGFQSDPFYMHNGQIVIPIDGYLQFTEVAAPAEYVVDNRPFGMPTGENVSLSKRVYNDLELCEIRLQKYESDGVTPIPGVEFELKFLEEAIKPTANKSPHFQRLLEVGESVIYSTDDKGEVSFDNLDQGKYQITEIKTHPGHGLLKEPIIVTIPMQMSMDEANEYGNVDFSSAKEDASYTDNWFFYSCLYEVTNNAVFVVPMTGSSGFWKYSLMGVGLIVLTCSGLLIHEHISKKRKRKI